MKKFLLIAALIAASGAGFIYAGVMPEPFYAWVDSRVPPAVAQAVAVAGGAQSSVDRRDLAASEAVTSAGGREEPAYLSVPRFAPGEEYSFIARSVIAGVRAQESGIEIPVSLPGKSEDYVTEYLLREVEQAIDALRREQPDIFWISLGAYNLEWNGSRETMQGTLTVHLDYCYTSDEVESVKSKQDDIIGELIKSAPSDPVEAVTFFHDWIVENTIYDRAIADRTSMQGYEYAFNIDGVFIEGRAVCEGFSKALKVLCDRAGIPCKSVFGVANGEKHSWNYVELYGQWYLVDVTWDDPIADEAVLLHDYFLKGADSLIGGVPVSKIYINDYADYPELARKGFMEQ